MADGATTKQLDLLKVLIKQTGHPMKIPDRMNKAMADSRIRHLLKYRDKPTIKPLYL